MDYAFLKAELDKSEYSNLTNEEAATLLNQEFLAEPRVTIYKREFINYVVVNHINIKMMAILNTNAAYLDNTIPEAGGLTLRLVLQAALAYINMGCSDTEKVDPNNANFQGQIAIMHSVGVFNEAELAAFWNLFRETTSRAQQLLETSVTAQDIGHVRNLDKIEACRVLDTQVREAANAVLIEIQRAQEEMKQGETVTVPTLQNIIDKFSEVLNA